MKKRPGVGVSIIIKKDKKILLGRRISSHGKNSWQFPGGHIEFNEDIYLCCKREVFEETGVRIKNIERIDFTNDVFLKENKHYITLFFLAEYDYGKLEIKEPTKCDSWNWFDCDKLPNPLFLPILNLLKQHGTLCKFIT